ncbi:MAG: hypothetical protein JSR59_01705 [Proteobacteria bacterium]|nr:hypothetical protein [Pseudomonadota bacterium]
MQGLQTSISTLGIPGYACPAWFAAPPSMADAPSIVLVDSAGPNVEDLLAAGALALADAGVGARIALADDARDASTAAQVAEAAVAWGADVVLGHYGARTAVPASRIYGRHGVLFLAPGTSATSLCAADAPTTWQCFGRDCEQLQCLADAAAQAACIAIVAQTDNYGADLAQGLDASLGARRCVARIDGEVARTGTTTPAWPAIDHTADLAYVFGSKEFAARVLADDAFVPASTPLVFADECYGAEFLSAPRLAARSHVAYLERTGDTLVDRSATALRACAARWMGREPGAYFETSYLAMRAFAAAWQAGRRGADAIGASIASRTWLTPFGALCWNASRQLTGHRWTLQLAGRPRTQPTAAVAARVAAATDTPCTLES